MQEKSAKAKASANQNKDPARVGQSGYIGKEAQWQEDMAELVEEYPDLARGVAVCSFSATCFRSIST